MNNRLKLILSSDPIKYPLTGIGRYTLELARQLECREDTEVFYLHGTRITRELPDVPAVPTEPPSIQRLKQALLKIPIAVDAASSFYSLVKGSALKHMRDAVLHGPNFYLPPFNGPSVVTVHDLSVVRWAHCHPPERVRHLDRQIRVALRRSDLIVTDSHFVREEISDHYHIPYERLAVVPLAAGEEFRPREAPVTSAVLGRLGLEHGGYCLFSGTIEPRKNLESLLSAYGRLPAALRKEFPLVICGYKGWKSGHLHRSMADAQGEGWLKYLGYLDDRDLPILFAGARVFIYPSLYEGFGLPVLEAMASGVPVICSSSSSLPEVVGDAACLFDPLDVDSLTEMIAIALHDEDWRRTLSAAGIVRAKSFSWRKCADDMCALYRQLSAARSARSTA